MRKVELQAFTYVLVLSESHLFPLPTQIQFTHIASKVISLFSNATEIFEEFRVDKNANVHGTYRKKDQYHLMLVDEVVVCKH